MFNESTPEVDYYFEIHQQTTNHWFYLKLLYEYLMKLPFCYHYKTYL